ncbi:hypothetical protein GCM10023093_31350 [Nemorincola caseinilytica]|uniref:T9SS type A sorting domain-containing protein n=1 Tax=Nemorincola caseinilytica TaxID=2054315 RepID=A0ABP8NNW5_9BACT
MKRPFLRIPALLLALLPFHSFAKTVDETTARTIGCNYLVRQGVQNVKTPDDLALSYAPVSQIDGRTVADLYVFNIKNGQGFVLVSGDDRVAPVLAYSDEASFHIDQVAPAAVVWVNWYKRQIEYVVTHQLDPKVGTAEKWASLKIVAAAPTAARTTSVAPMLTTLWNQSPNYNALCPGIGSSLAVTGCVATAMAQVMKFWNWPVMGDGMHTYEDMTYGPLTADFGATTYQWSSMPNSISIANNAIATLMSHCGISVNMRYGTAASGGSGAWPVSHYSSYVNSSEYAFKTYFHYKPTVHGLLREGDYMYTFYPIPSIPSAIWISSLKAELDAGRPFIYTGNDGTSGGHAWVADGYRSTDDFFHFNWGWGGAGPNGYYSVDDVAPPVLGTGGSGGNYNMMQTATVGIEPDTYPAYTDNIKLKRPVMHMNSTPLPYGKAFSLQTKILNSRSTPFNGDVCAQVYDNTTLKGTVATLTGVSVAAGDSSAMLTFGSTGMTNLLPKTYTLKLMYRNTGAGTWTPIGDNGTIHNYSTLDVKNDTDMRLYDTIEIASGLPMHTGDAVSIGTNINNWGWNDFYGWVRAQLVDLSTGTVYPIQTRTGVSIAAYEYNIVWFDLATLSAPNGLYALEIQHKYDGIGEFYTTGSKNYDNPRLVQVGDAADIPMLESMKNDVFVYPNPAKDLLTVMFNRHKVSEVLLMDVTGKVLRKFPADPNASSMQLPVKGQAPGIYMIQLATDKGTITKKINIAE